MNGDGDILGTRRRPETVQSGEILMKAPTLPAGGILQQSQGDAATAAARHAPGASPLKRARSVGGGASGIRGGETEKRVDGHTAGEVPVDQLTPEQLVRFQAWKRSRFERGCIRELVMDRAAPTLLRTMENGQGTGVLKETSTVAVASLAKMFVGDVVEEAKRAQAERGEEGPLLPKDLHDARARLTNDGRGPPLRSASPREGGLVGRGRGATGGSLLGSGAVLVKGNAI